MLYHNVSKAAESTGSEGAGSELDALESSTSSAQGTQGTQAQGAEGAVPRKWSWKERILWLGGVLMDAAEAVGETVVSVLGLDDSYFQDVLDDMSPDEMAAAQAVHLQRTAEYRAAGMLPPEDEIPGEGADGGGGEGGEYAALRTAFEGSGLGQVSSRTEGGLQMQPTVSVSRSTHELNEIDEMGRGGQQEPGNQGTVDII